MHRNDDKLPALDRALSDEGFRAAIESLARSYVADGEQQGLHDKGALGEAEGWYNLRRAHQKEMLDKVAAFARRSESLEYEDEDLNALRSLWLLCYRRFARERVKATNLVTKKWMSSSQDNRNLRVQEAAIARGVEIERTFIISRELPRSVLHELRHNIVKQLNAQIKLRVIRPNSVEAHVDTTRLGTMDFVIFDSKMVYATFVDDALDQREQKRTLVRLQHDKEIIAYAEEAWGDICARATRLDEHNLHRYVNPYE